MSDIKIDGLSDVEIEAGDNVAQIEATNLDALVDTDKSIVAEVEPKNYVLSSGGMYNGGTPPGQTPQWLLDAVQEQLTTGDGNITSVLQDLQTLVGNLEIGVNQAVARVQNAEESISTLETSVVSRLDTNEAAILDLDATKVTDTEAQAISANVIESTFNTGTATVDAYISGIASTYVDASSAIAQDIDLIVAEQNNISASVTYTSEAIVDTVDGPRAKNSLTVDADGNIAGYVAEADGSTSDFTIFADTFKVTNGTGVYTPLEINTGDGKAYFTGEVAFRNLGIDGSSTSINGGKIKTGKVESTDGSTYIDLDTNNIKMTNTSSSFTLDSTVNGSSSTPNIQGAYIKGVVVEGATIDATSDITSPTVYGDTFRIKAEGYPGNSGPVVLTDSKADQAALNDSVYLYGTPTITFSGRADGAGYSSTRQCKSSQVFNIRASGAGTASNDPNGDQTLILQVSLGGGPWTNVQTITSINSTMRSLVMATSYTNTTTSSIAFRAAYRYNLPSTSQTMYLAVDIMVTSSNT